MRVLLFLGLLALSVPAQARDVSLRTECYGNRCVVYAPGGRRLASVTDYGHGRQVVKDNTGRRIATLQTRQRRVTVRRTFP